MPVTEQMNAGVRLGFRMFDVPFRECSCKLTNPHDRRVHTLSACERIGQTPGSTIVARHFVWFRSDLRIADNPALHAATSPAPDAGVVGVYVISPGEWAAHDVAPVRVEFILRTLRVLSDDLAKRNIPLLVAAAPTPRDVPRVLSHLAALHHVSGVFFNREYEVNEAARDRLVAAEFTRRGVECRMFDGQVVLTPGSVRTQDGRPYTVFTPFKKRWLSVLNERAALRVLPAPKPQTPTGINPSDIPSRVEGFVSTIDPSLWPAGEHEAAKRLKRFTGAALGRYKSDRDHPAIDGTSTLSPYLACGAISPGQCLKAAIEANDGKLDSGGPGPVQWISELVWREFYTHIVEAFPRVCKHRAFKPETDRIRWRDCPRDFEAWCRGETGVPIVDAAMRQLTATGWMHNRLRMIVAMYLTKDLFIDWRMGERHFMRNLVDGYLASNNGGWQWSASTGTDAAPYFRIFNPVSQSRTYDARGEFIRRFVPELAGVDAEAIHDPPPLVRARLGYPEAIVDHAASRDRVLKAFKAPSPA
jgi:deoxyribodipyrimidine photo-lyase